MIYKYGDMFSEVNESQRDILVIPANSKIKSGGELVMGAGVAKIVRDRYDSIGRLAAVAVRNGYFEPHFYGFTPIYGTRFALFQSKIDPFQPSRYEYIEKSIKQMIKVLTTKKIKQANEFNIKDVKVLQFDTMNIPLPGVGLGGLDRDIVLEMFDTLMPKDDDRFVIWEKEAPVVASAEDLENSEDETSEDEANETENAQKETAVSRLRNMNSRKSR